MKLIRNVAKQRTLHGLDKWLEYKEEEL